MAAELLRAGLPPGCEAPDFELPSTDGTTLRLSDLRGQPVVLHFVSYTCPVTRGGVSTMRELMASTANASFRRRCSFAKPTRASATGPTASYAEKLEDARAYKREEHIPWSVLIDDLAGSVQRAYGGLAAAVYLIDSRGQRRLLRHVGPVARAATGARGASGPRRHRFPGRQGHRSAAASGRCDRCRAARAACAAGDKR